MSQQQFLDSRSSGVHQQLNRLEGTWEGITTTWFEPGEPVDVSAIIGTIRALFGGKYLLHEYRSAFGGKPLEGLAIYSYHIDLQKYQAAWIDSFHTDTFIMFSESNREAAQFAVNGGYTYLTPGQEQQWGWRTEIQMIGDDALLITAYNITPQGEESKATETKYQRVKNS